MEESCRLEEQNAPTAAGSPYPEEEEGASAPVSESPPSDADVSSDFSDDDGGGSDCSVDIDEFDSEAAPLAGFKPFTSSSFVRTSMSSSWSSMPCPPPRAPRVFPATGGVPRRKSKKAHLAWSAADDEALKQGILKHCKNWALVNTFLPERTESAITIRGIKMLKEDTLLRAGVEQVHGSLDRTRDNSWQASEEVALREGMAQHGKDWDMVAKMLPGRSDMAVRLRGFKILKNDAALRAVVNKKIAEMATEMATPEDDGDSEVVERSTAKGVKSIMMWTAEEDETLKEAITTHGKKWDVIVPLLPRRTEVAIVQRAIKWMKEDKELNEKVSLITPPLPRSSLLNVWTESEESALREGIKQHGKAWDIIAQMIPTRTEMAICQRGHKLLRDDEELFVVVQEISARDESASESAHPKRWLREEVISLREGLEKYGKEWRKIAPLIPRRTEGAIIVRGMLLLKEDSELYACVERIKARRPLKEALSSTWTTKVNKWKSLHYEDDERTEQGGMNGFDFDNQLGSFAPAVQSSTDLPVTIDHLLLLDGGDVTKRDDSYDDKGEDGGEGKGEDEDEVNDEDEVDYEEDDEVEADDDDDDDDDGEVDDEGEDEDEGVDEEEGEDEDEGVDEKEGEESGEGEIHEQATKRARLLEALDTE